MNLTLLGLMVSSLVMAAPQGRIFLNNVAIDGVRGQQFSNATVRISFTESLAEGINVFCFAYYQSTAAISYDNSGMVTGAEYAYAS